MTLEELRSKHYGACNVSDGWKTHERISIEYAIDVLERMKEELRMGFPFADHDRISLWLTNKIDEEKNNLNH